jgi:hypothetical protein
MEDRKTTILGVLLAVVTAVQPLLDGTGYHFDRPTIGRLIFAALVAIFGYLAADKKSQSKPKGPNKMLTIILFMGLSVSGFSQFEVTSNKAVFKIGHVNLVSTESSVTLTKEVTDSIGFYTILYKTHGVADLYANFTATDEQYNLLYNTILSMLSVPDGVKKTISGKLGDKSLQLSNVKNDCLININGAQFILSKRELKILFAKT